MIDPTREAEFKATVPVKVTNKDGATVVVSEERTYRLRFALRELYRAELLLGAKLMKDGAAGVNAIIQRFTDGSLDGLVSLFSVMASRDRPDATWEELIDAAEFDAAQSPSGLPEGLRRACYHVLNINLPEADPKGPAPSAEQIATPETTSEIAT